MIYYVSLLTINQFSIEILEKFDNMLLSFSRSKKNTFTPKILSKKLNIPEIDALNLLYESENLGLVKLTYSISCSNCGTSIEINDIRNLYYINCNKCYHDNCLNDPLNINYYYLALV